MLAVQPQGGVPWVSANPVDQEDVTVTNGAIVTLTLSKITKAITAVWLRIDLADIRFRVDASSALTATTGPPLLQLDTVILNPIQAAAFRMIGQQATSAKVYAIYFAGG